MKNLILTSLAIVVSTGFLAGCGGGGGVNSGIDDSKPGNELTAQEIDQVCEATLDYVEEQVDLMDLTCRGTGVVAATIANGLGGGDEDIQAACQAAYEDCLENDAIEDSDWNLTCDDSPDSVPECDATVGQYETCMTDFVDQFAVYSDEILPCDEINEENIDQVVESAQNPPSERPPSCEVVDETCPSVFNEQMTDE